jgi:hypothetical protein
MSVNSIVTVPTGGEFISDDSNAASPRVEHRIGPRERLKLGGQKCLTSAQIETNSA